MDVITLSSDSDENEVTLQNYCPLTNVEYDIYSMAWDDDVHPPINYDLDVTSPKKEVESSTQEEKIEDFPTQKLSEDHCTENEENGFDISEHSFTFAESQLIQKSESASQCLSKKKQKLLREEGEQKKLLREQKKMEREKQREEKKAEQLRQKALKAVLVENQRNLKPEENMKFLKVHIDNEIINSSYGVNLISLLQENNVQYVVESHCKSYTITWSKSKTEKTINDNGHVEELNIRKEEKEVLYVLHWSKAVKLVHNQEFLTHLETIKSLYCDKKLTVTIYGMEKYFNYWKMKKKRDWQTQAKGNAKIKAKERIFEEAPFITKDQLELALIDLQLLGKSNSRLLETPEEFSCLILNMTKSLSQIEYKLDKLKRQDDLGWIASDSYRSVKLDKNEHGLLRLWQQQICQFNSVGWETAQAIVSHYNSPASLINQYKIKNSKEGELLLENIKIRRDAGILSSSRRVGPQLSKKIYKFFTSDDSNAEL